jgi:hypothetical protein
MSSDIPGPAAVWNSLSQDDRCEYLRLRASFHHGQKMSSKDRRVITFRRELNTVVQYLNRSSDKVDARCIVVGVCFVQGIACINTRQLKVFLNRCKSSINGSFQQLGYVAVRTKSKARNCCVAALPALEHDPNLLRQWTCRVASDNALVCFASSLHDVAFPEISDSDLLDDKKTRPAPVPIVESKYVSFGPKILDDDLPSLIDFESDSSQSIGMGLVPISFSVDFRELEDAFGKGDLELEPLDPWKKVMAKSKSADFQLSAGWDIFGDEFQL